MVKIVQSSNQSGTILKNLKHVLDYFTLFALLDRFLGSFIVLMPSVRIYNVNGIKNKKTLTEKLCSKLWLVKWFSHYVHLILLIFIHPCSAFILFVELQHQIILTNLLLSVLWLMLVLFYCLFVHYKEFRTCTENAEYDLCLYVNLAVTDDKRKCLMTSWLSWCDCTAQP